MLISGAKGVPQAIRVHEELLGNGAAQETPRRVECSIADGVREMAA